MTPDATAAPAGRLGARFPRLWTSTVLTALGDGVLLVAVPLAALQLTRSPVLVMAIRQAHAPSEVLNRVTASYWLLSRGAMPLGAFLSGSFAEFLTIPGVFILLAVLTVALLPIALRLPATAGEGNHRG
jgi:hypothetical protein